MESKPLFADFARRLTRSYVVLAITLIVLVALSTSTVAFIEYARTLNESVSNATQHALARAAYYQTKHETLLQYAPALVKDVERPRLRIAVYDADQKLAAGRNARPTRLAVAVAALLGLRPTVTRIGSGVIFVGPDLDGFERFLDRYWLLLLPIGIVAIVLAWLIGRRITSRAIEPLTDVTQALRTIAAGDFTPKLLQRRGEQLRELTGAYDDVAYRLNVATAERLRYENEMRQFIADAGHELRTPLTIVMGYLDALRQGVVRDPEGITRVQDTMLDESRRMRTVIEKLIFLARLEYQAASTSTSVDPVALVQRALDTLAPIAGERLTFSHDECPAVLGDESELYEGVKNVIENALKYAPQSGVTVAVGGDSGGTRIVVRDRGPGMSAVDIEHAFDRFYRGSARASAEGSGLGLAIAKRAVQRAGGTIAIESQPGEGTTVMLMFPASL